MRGTDIPALLAELAPVLQAALDPRIELVVDVRPDCPRAACEPRTLEAGLVRAVRQLLDAMHDSGRVVLRAACSDDAGSIAVTVDAGRGHAVTQLLPCARTAPTPHTGVRDAPFSG